VIHRDRRPGKSQGARRQVQFLRSVCLLALISLALGCAKREEILEGQRFDVRTPLDEAIPTEDGSSPETTHENRAVPIRLPKVQNQTAWTHRNGGPDHAASHPALATSLTHLWSASIGGGNDRKHRITSDPIVAGGQVFTLDSRARVTAFSLIGAATWTTDLTPASDRDDEATGGGLAYDGGVLYVTTGFGRLHALDATTGREIWVQRLNAPVTAAPMVYKNLVYVVSRDNKAWAINTKNGRIDWTQASTEADAGLIGGASPAIGGGMVFLPFSSGEVVAAMTRNGLRVWSVAVSGSRRGQARSNIGDITGDPVVTGSRVYAANQSGRTVAIARRDGERLWTANEGAYGPVWPVDNSVFLVSDASQLVRLDARTGEVIWAVDLPLYRREKQHRDAFAHFGPILAGGRLIVASSDGELRSFDPVNGDLLSSVGIPSGAASQPAIVDGVLYVLSQNGQVHAYR
jgi:outer membrane protein assembly factor BamB